MKRIVFAVLGAVSLSACAQAPDATGAAKAPAKAPAAMVAAPAARPLQVQPGTPDARAVEAVRKLNPQVQIDHVGAAPMPGFREVAVGGQLAYVSDDGKYVFVSGAGGALFDATTRRNLSEESLAATRRELLKTIPASERIVFAPANPVHTVTVFTDVECGYCRKLHSEIAQYNKQGIAVEYLAFPRMGPGSEDFRKMIAVWCAPDRKKALTDAKNDRSLPMRDCKNTVAMQYDVGQRAGLTGTPMILAADGTQLGGYVPAPQLRAALDKLAAEAKGASTQGEAQANPAG